MKIKNKKIKSLFIMCLLSAILCLTIITVNIKNEDKHIAVNSQILSNTKIGWGIKRNDKHEQPDFGNKNKEILD